MRYFLDMNIPIYFCMQMGDPLEIKAREFIKNKGTNSYLLCSYIINTNLPRWMNRQQSILFEFNQKVKDNSYTFFTSDRSKILLQKDKVFTERLFLNYNKSKDKDNFVKTVNDIFNLLRSRIEYFIKFYINEVVIPESEIDFDLKSCLFTWLNPNDSDAKTIASAVQEHNLRDLDIITADKKDWKKELLEEIHNNVLLKKKYPKLPNIGYLQDL